MNIEGRERISLHSLCNVRRVVRIEDSNLDSLFSEESFVLSL